TIIHANVCIQANVSIGNNCVIYPQVVIREGCEVHHRVVLQPGAIIGSCGFGYLTNEKGEHIKLNQIGIVIIEDDCEIGSNTTIDRARFKATRIRKGTKIDNLVQIAHNVEIGEHNIIIAQTGIAGSSKTGKYVVMGGQVGVTGHIDIADFVQIATRSGISKSITEKGAYRGSPAIPLNDYNRYKVKVRNIAEYVKRIEQLEKRLAAMEAGMVS
ncbi:MAG: UDP-3-O-(3-hydroxymyristoyl)glucosamine N-acyltransferase, partial [Chlamydiales bacterium]|nr:UDP-3-O-(3-hydroxymyristoyl)glucosamine N-acyltransferase [Chlamydiales bacterium]